MSKRREKARPQPADDVNHAVEMGELVAHEVNNLLNNILLNVAILNHKAPEALGKEAVSIREAATRAGSFINRWQRLTPQPPPLQPVDLNEIAAAAVTPWKAEQARPGITIHFEPAADLPLVLGNAGELDRLVRLLLANAAAVVKTGTITVRTEKAASGVIFCVQDSGPPIEPALVDQVFEPFFLARPTPGASEVGHQADLGLAVGKRLARRQQGSIQVENRPEGGVRVVVQLRPAEDATG
jgi:signal transduction histidine kinase